MSLRRSKRLVGGGAIVSLGLAALVSNLLPLPIYGDAGMVKMVITLVLTVFFLLVAYCLRLLSQDRKNKSEPVDRLQRKLEP